MKTIFKFPLQLIERQGVLMPDGARVLSVQEQYGRGLMLWAIVDDAKPYVTREFAICGTGKQLPNGLHKYISTLQIGSFVWHVFEVGE